MRFSAPPLSGPTGGFIVPVSTPPGAGITVNNAFSTGNAGTSLETILVALSTAAAYGAVIVGTAAAANKAVAELNNPAASGKTLYVYSLDFFVPVTMAMQVLLDGTTLAPAGTGFNLSVGGSAGVARVAGSNQLATTGSLIYTSPTLAANADYPIPLAWLVRIPAGHNLQLQGQTVNQAFTANVRWFEISL